MVDIWTDNVIGSLLLIDYKRDPQRVGLVSGLPIGYYEYQAYRRAANLTRFWDTQRND